MQTQIFAQGITVPDPLKSYIEKTLATQLEHFAARLTRVEVHLKDQNSKRKNGVDKHCLIEARPRGLDPIAAEHDASEWKVAVHEAVLKLERALHHKIDKEKNH